LPMFDTVDQLLVPMTTAAIEPYRNIIQVLY